MRVRYVDRGIIKWSPFDALTGYKSLLKQIRHRLGKGQKPELSEDALEELDRTLSLAKEKSLETEVRYFKDGYVRFTFGKIEKLDYVHKEIVLSTKERFRAQDVLSLEITE